MAAKRTRRSATPESSSSPTDQTDRRMSNTSESSTSKPRETTSRAQSETSNAQPSRLTEAQKRSNHVRSEKKRRAGIRDSFDRIAEIVPGLEGQGRSEPVVLKKTLDFIETILEERQQLVEEIERRGGQVEEPLKVPEYTSEVRQRRKEGAVAGIRTE